MNTSLIKKVKKILAGATADEALVCASMSLQVAMLQRSNRDARNLQPALKSVLSELNKEK